MKKFMRMVLLIILAIFLSGVGFLYFTEGADAFSWKTVKIQEIQHIEGEEITDIFIETGSTDVEIIPYSEEGIDIELSGEVSEKMKNAFQLTVKENNNTLEIQLERLLKPSLTFFAINKATKLTVKIPATLYNDLMVETTSGDINFTGSSTNQIELKANSGDITMQNSTSEQIVIKATSGDIFIEDSSSENMSFEANSGDIKGEGLEEYSNIDIQTTSGNVVLNTSETSFSLDFDTNSGDGKVRVPGFMFEVNKEERIIGEKGDGERTITVNTNSGDFLLE